MKSVLTYVRSRKQEDEEEIMETNKDHFSQLMDKVGRRFRIFTLTGLVLSFLSFCGMVLKVSRPDLFPGYTENVTEDTEDDDALLSEYVSTCLGALVDLLLFLALWRFVIKKKFSSSVTMLKIIYVKLGLLLRTFMHGTFVYGIWEGLNNDILVQGSVDYISNTKLAYVAYSTILLIVAFVFELIILYGIIFKNSKAIGKFMTFRKFMYFLIAVQLVVWELAVWIIICLVLVIFLSIELSFTRLVHDVVKLEENLKNSKKENPANV